MKSITWKIGGEAGFGIMTTGQIFSRVAVRHGYHIFDYVEYPSLIRGGHNVYEVRISPSPVYSQEKGVDFLFALNKETIDRHITEMKKGGLVVYDGEQFEVNAADYTKDGYSLYNLPFRRITAQIGAPKLMENNVALGAVMGIFSMDLRSLLRIIENTFRKKGQEVIDLNQKAAQAGFDYVKNNPPKKFSAKLPPVKSTPKMVISGNEAIAMGAISAGCKFFVAYPMTPTSAILHFMAEHANKSNLVVKHAEDEISVINMAIGASYAGVRSMTATAGGGFSLMVEGLGLAGVTETPLVIVVGQRPGPATGMPTWTSQGDLEFLIHAAQDEFPRIILTPGDMDEAFYLTAEAFNLADIYQTPVFILEDKYLGESHASVTEFDPKKITVNRGKMLSWDEGEKTEDYLRYKITQDGISSRALPGMKKALFMANSYEHNEYGWTTEEGKMRIMQAEKRARKLKKYQEQIPKQNLYGEEKADLTIVGWGSTKGPVLQALEEIKDMGIGKVNFLHITHAWPLPVENISQALGKAGKTLLIEGNYYGQMGKIIRSETGYDFKNTYFRYDGRPFYPEDIITKVKEVLAA